MDGNTDLFSKSCGLHLQPLLVALARDQHKAVSAAGETVGVGSADSRGGFGDKPRGIFRHGRLVVFRSTAILMMIIMIAVLT